MSRTNWPLLVRTICEAYNTTPSQLENETQDQLYIMVARKADLARLGGVSRVSVEEARELGVVKAKAVPGGPQSLVQRIRAATKERKEKEKTMGKRQRRREFDKQLAERRARGEQI